MIILGTADDFTYTSQGNCVSVDRVNDAADFKETCHAMRLLGLFIGRYPCISVTLFAWKFAGITEDEIGNVMRILAAILHLGNISFEKIDSESCTVDKVRKNSAKTVIL